MNGKYPSLFEACDRIATALSVAIDDAEEVGEGTVKIETSLEKAKALAEAIEAFYEDR